MIHIAAAPEVVFYVINLPVTNTLFTSLITTLILTVGALLVYTHQTSQGRSFLAVELLFQKGLQFVDSITKDRRASLRVFPLVATFFLFIVTANVLGLLPGFLGAIYAVVAGVHVPLFRSPNSDLNTTIALALFSVVATQVLAISLVGMRQYIGRFINFTGIVPFLIGLFELISEGMKLISFSFRLFGNLFAGEVLLLVAAYFLPVFLPVPFMLLELFVGIIQAFIFAVLTLAFIKSATIGSIST